MWFLSVVILILAIALLKGLFDFLKDFIEDKRYDMENNIKIEKAIRDLKKRERKLNYERREREREKQKGRKREHQRQEQKQRNASEDFIKKGHKKRSMPPIDDEANKKGSYGETLIYNELHKMNGYKKIMTNLYIPNGDKFTEIDLLLINNTGLYVLESKNYGGIVIGDGDYREWVQRFPTKRRGLKGDNKEFRFFNPIKQNEIHLKSLKKLLANIDHKLFTSIIVFNERCLLKVFNCSVDVIQRDELLCLMDRYNNERMAVFSNFQIDEIYNKLKKYTNVSDEIKNEHIENIKKGFM